MAEIVTRFDRRKTDKYSPGLRGATMPEKPKSLRVHPLVVGFIILMLGVGFAAVFTIQAITDTVNHGLIGNRENGFKNRAVVCQVVLNQGSALPTPCLEPEVVKYYQPIRP